MQNSDVNEKRLALALEAAGLDLWENDLLSGQVSYQASKTLAELGYEETDSCANMEHIYALIHPEDIPLVQSALADHREGRTASYRCEFRLRAKNGDWIWYANYGRIMDEANEQPGRRFIGVTFNIHDRKCREDELRRMNACLTQQNGLLDDLNHQLQALSTTDPLTLLPNRRLLLQRLQQVLSANARSGFTGALLFLDIDNFKTINDVFGHDIGDEFLRQVAARLQQCVRSSDTIARFGGDEFVVMLEYQTRVMHDALERTRVVCDKVLQNLSLPYQLGIHPFQTSASIGVTLMGNDLPLADEVLKQADIALYQAKKSGRNTLRFFEPDMQHAVASRAALEDELRIAIEQQQFELYYQVKVDADGLPLGAEGLARWNHPERGVVMPGDFIPLAEETGLIRLIGSLVLDMACARLASWQKDFYSREMILSVNVSASEFRHRGFVESVLDCLARHAVDPRGLRLELTESLLLDNVEQVIASMRILNEVGVRFSLDDFGTGYSSLQYLKQLPLDQVKIDRSFVCNLVDDSSDRTILHAIIAMMHALDIDVIAEGVETRDQHDFLLRSGCSKFQGYLFGKPLPVAQFESILQDLIPSPC
jgi:diguanylate cyclase (GGDEF)-like protein/PAS domain S-box-containing protein